MKLNELYNALHRLNRQMFRISQRNGYGKEKLYHGQARLLMIILQNNGASQKELTELMDIRPSSLTEMLNKLEQNRLIEKIQDDNDKRVMHIYLTEEGKRTAKQFDETKEEYAQSFFNALTEKEQEQFLNLVEKLCEGLENDENNYWQEFNLGGHHSVHGINNMHNDHCHHGHHGNHKRFR